MPTFSVITPVFKAEPYLHQCIDSVLNQSCQDFEFILVDDGSPDACPRICDEYARNDDRIIVIHQENRGSVAARKAGMQRSCGDYILTLDSDDYLDSKLLEELQQIILDYKPDAIKFNCVHFSGSSSDLIRNKFQNVFFDEKNIDVVRNALLYDDTSEGMNHGGILYSLWSLAAKRELLLRYQLDAPEGIRMGDDLAVSAPLIANCSSIFFAENTGYYYRDTPNSMVNSFNPDELRSLNLLIHYLMDVMQPEKYNAICIYTLRSVLHYLSLAAKNFSKERYMRWIQENLSEYLFETAISAHIARPNFKESAKLFLLKQKKYSLLRMLFTKNGG